MKKYSSEERRTHLKVFKRSGLSGQEYCRRHNIYPTTFYGWTKREKKIMKQDKKSSAKLVKIQPKRMESIPTNQEILIEYKNTRIHLPLERSAEQLKIILTHLDSHYAS